MQTQAKEWKEVFENLDLEDFDYEDYGRYGSYIPDYEMAEMAAEEKTDDLFEDWLWEVIGLMKTQHLNKGFACIAGMYIAAKTAELHDEYNCLGFDPNEFLAAKYYAYLEKLFNEMVNIHLNFDKLIEASKSFFRHIHDEAVFEVRFRKKIDVFFSMLTTEAQIATAFAAMLKDFPDSKADFPKLQLKITSLIAPDQWLALAEEIYLNDPQIGMDLMDHYLKNNQYADFQRIAMSCFLYSPSTYQSFISERIKDDADPEFTKMVLTSVTKKITPLIRIAGWPK